MTISTKITNIHAIDINPAILIMDMLVIGMLDKLNYYSLQHTAETSVFHNILQHA